MCSSHMLMTRTNLALPAAQGIAPRPIASGHGRCGLKLYGYVLATTTAAQISAHMITSHVTTNLNPIALRGRTFAKTDGITFAVIQSTLTIAGQTCVVDPMNRYRQHHGLLSGCIGLTSRGHPTGVSAASASQT